MPAAARSAILNIQGPTFKEVATHMPVGEVEDKVYDMPNGTLADIKD